VCVVLLLILCVVGVVSRVCVCGGVIFWDCGWFVSRWPVNNIINLSYLKKTKPIHTLTLIILTATSTPPHQPIHITDKRHTAMYIYKYM
jgi:hypothetical protein